jgi:hypothetical protein
MIIPRLQQAIQRLDELPVAQQEEIARLIEGQLMPATVLPSYAGSMPDLPDTFEEDLMSQRHAVPPTPPMEDLLHDVLRCAHYGYRVGSQSG